MIYIVASQSRMFDASRSGELVDSGPPIVTLRNAFAHPYDSAIAAARTCYAQRLIGAEEITELNGRRAPAHEHCVEERASDSG